MDRIFPTAITPSHKQVAHVDYNRPRFRINMYKPPASFDSSIYLTTRGARICNILHVVRLISKLKEKIRIVGHTNTEHCQRYSVKVWVLTSHVNFKPHPFLPARINARHSVRSRVIKDR